MKRYTVLFVPMVGALAAALTTASSPSPEVARTRSAFTVLDDWPDWANSKRSLSIHINTGGAFATAVRAAIARWNTANAGNDWMMTEVANAADANVTIGEGPVAAGNAGEAAPTTRATGFLGLGSGELVSVDINVLAGQSVAERDRTIIHELGHCMRLAHTPGGTDVMNSSNTATTPSANDISEAEASDEDPPCPFAAARNARRNAMTDVDLVPKPNSGIDLSGVLDVDIVMETGPDVTASVLGWTPTEVTVRFDASSAASHNEVYTVTLFYPTSAASYTGVLTITDQADPLGVPHSVAGADINAIAGTPFILDGRASFHDDPSTYFSGTWFVTPAELGLFADYGLMTLPAGNYVATHYVKDYFGQVSQDQINIFVAAGPCNLGVTSLCVPLDSTHTVVDMSAFSTCQRNDDGSGQILLSGWAFDFYGTLWSDVYVNNNGNVSFGQPFSTFSSSGFPIVGFPMIAPFWGDVDTRSSANGSGTVWFKEYTAANDGVNRLVVTWDHVGYYNTSTDKLNTFQLILTDGQDPLIGIGNNACFCYDGMEWTTGSASGGVGGFGGTPATVGANQGDGTTFFQIGRFDHPGTDYDGPGGQNDGVGFLSDSTFCLSVGGGNPNTPPVFVNPPSMIEVEAGTTLSWSIQAIGPELAETVTMTVDTFEFTGLPGGAPSCTGTSGNPATLTCTYSPCCMGDVGLHVLQVTATDDGTPTRSTTLLLPIRVTAAGTVSTRLCDPGVPNSTGLPADLMAVGSDVAADNDLQLLVVDLPQNSLGYFLVSQGTVVVPMAGGSQGTLCIGSSAIGRYSGNVLSSGAAGSVSLQLDLTTTPLQPGGPVSIVAFETWYWQYWYRDAMGGSPVSNFSHGGCVTFR